MSPQQSPTLPQVASPGSLPTDTTSEDILIQYDNSPVTSYASHVFTDPGTRASTASSLSTTNDRSCPTALFQVELGIQDATQAISQQIKGNGHKKSLSSDSTQVAQTSTPSFLRGGKDTPKGAVTTATQNLSSPAQADLQPVITARELVDLWTHASLLAHNQGYAAALTVFQGVLKRPGIPSKYVARIQLNMGILLTHLGRLEAAAETIYGAVMGVAQRRASAISIEEAEEDKLQALAVFLLANVVFDVGSCSKAGECFGVCLNYIDEVSRTASDSSRSLDTHLAHNPTSSSTNSIGMSIPNKSIEEHRKGLRQPSRTLQTSSSSATLETSRTMQTHNPTSDHSTSSAVNEPHTSSASFNYTALGLSYTLDRRRVRWNQAQCREREAVEARTPMASRVQWRMHRLPKNMIFEAPQLEDTQGRNRARSDSSSGGVRTHVLDSTVGDTENVSAATTQSQLRIERRCQDATRRRTRMLIRLGDLRLNKPLPPLPESAALESIAETESASMPMHSHATALRSANARGRAASASASGEVRRGQGVDEETRLRGVLSGNGHDGLGLRNVTW